jgi:hypothetical protein
MLRKIAVWLGVAALSACSGDGVEAIQSAPLADPTVDFEVILPDVDTDWPLAEDTDGQG